jgi:LuxR family transcriptional regulator, maltose regulon positive regulatory protein
VTEVRGAGQSVLALDQLLLDAKVSIPRPRPDSVSRAKLIEAARHSDCRVVGMTAPAGYGKSTLLAEWAHAEDRRVAWVSLDRLDDDPVLLLTLIASAFARASRGGAGLVADMAGIATLGRAAPRLATVLMTSPHPFVLMLDDLHELRSPACRDVLEVVISGIPQGSQLVAASRSEQAHLPRLRAAGDVLEISGTDLALDPSGAEKIFAQVEVTLTPAEALAVTARTEGWPAGLHLAALIARDSGDGGLSISGDDRYVADYLYAEALSMMPEATQHFLRCTAVLDQLCAPLCDAVTGTPGAQDMLRALEAASMFVIPLDRRRTWYRYHALFREFLLSELHRAQPELVTTLHVRAADWYQTTGTPTLTVEHLLQTDERKRCIDIVSQLALSTYQAGHKWTVERWLGSLGNTAIESYPPLAVLAGWIAALTGNTTDALRWQDVLDKASFDGVPADGTASLESARAMLRVSMCAHGPEQAMVDAEIAFAQEPPWSPWRDLALAMSAEALLLVGDVDRAAGLFAESAALSATRGNNDILVLCESELAVLAMERGRWDQAEEHVQSALGVIQEHRMQDYATSVLAFVAAARISLHLGELEAADRHRTQAMRARPVCTFALPFLAVRVRLHLAKVSWSRGDLAATHHLLREVDDTLLRRPALGALVEEVRTFRAHAMSSDRGVVAGAPPLTPAELRLLPYLQTHLTIAEIGQRLFISRNTVNSEVASIYRKLGVSSRNDAVQQATAIGLIGG